MFEFLAGLNSDFKQVQVQVLNMVHSLTLNEVHAYIHEEKCKVVEKSAIVSKTTIGDRGGFPGRGHGGRLTSTLDDRDRLKCDHCG